MVSPGNMAKTAHWALRRMGERRTSRAVYIGGHGGGNLGDDLMLSIARDLLPQWELTDCAESWHEKRLARFGLSGARYFEHALLGGGTLISPFWYGKVEAAVGLGIPLSSLGTGAGSCGFIQDDGIDLSSWAPLLKRFKHLGVRGPRSLQRMLDMGIEHAEVVGDLALYHTRDKPIVPDSTPSIAVNLCLPAANEPQCGEAQRFEELVNTLRPYVQQGWSLRPYAMNAADVGPTAHLTERLERSVQRIPHLKSVEEFFAHVGPAVINIAVRLHGAILGCCAGVPPLILGYRDKCRDFAESLGLERWCVDLPSAEMGDVAIATAAAMQAAPFVREDTIARARAQKQTLIAYCDRITREGA